MRGRTCGPHYLQSGERSRSRRGRANPPDHPKALGDLLEHDLRRAAADRLDARIARHALDRGLAHEAHAAVELHAVVEDLVHQIAGQRLHHRHLGDAVLALGVEPGRVMHELAGRLDLGQAARQALAGSPACPTSGLPKAVRWLTCS